MGNDELRAMSYLKRTICLEIWGDMKHRTCVCVNSCKKERFCMVAEQDVSTPSISSTAVLHPYSLMCCTCSFTQCQTFKEDVNATDIASLWNVHCHMRAVHREWSHSKCLQQHQLFKVQESLSLAV